MKFLAAKEQGIKRSGLLILSLLLGACHQSPSHPTAKTPVNPPITTVDTGGYLPAVGQDSYLDAVGQVHQVAVPYVRENGMFSPQALLSGCSAANSTPGALFYKRSTFPSDLRLDGVNAHIFTLGDLKTDFLPAPYDAPIRKANGTEYEKSSDGKYIVQQAYPEIYLLGGIAGASDKGRELYFGFKYTYKSTVNGLPAFEPYVQVGDPATGRVSVADVQPIVDGVTRNIQMQPQDISGVQFEVVTLPNGITQIYLRPNMVRVYDRIQSSKGITYRAYQSQDTSRLLIWQGKIGDINSSPTSLENQIRKFELRINYGAFVKNGAVFTNQNPSEMDTFIKGRHDFIEYAGHPRFGQLRINTFNFQNDIIGSRDLNEEVFESYRDPLQRCTTALTDDSSAKIVAGDIERAKNYNFDPFSAGLVIGNPLPVQTDVTATVGMIASEAINFDLFNPAQRPTSPVLQYPSSDSYEFGMRFPQELQNYGYSTSFAVDFICKQTGQFDIPLTFWDSSNPSEKRTANMTLNCVQNADLRSPYKKDSSPTNLITDGSIPQQINAKVGNRIAFPLTFQTDQATSYRVVVDTASSDLTTKLNSNLGILPENNAFVSFPCLSAGSFDRNINLKTDGGIYNFPLHYTCSNNDQVPFDLPSTDANVSLVPGTTTTLALNAAVGSAAMGKLTLKFQNFNSETASQIAILSPTNLIMMAESGFPGQLNLRAEYKCTAVGQTTQQVVVRTQFSQATNIPITVTTNCKGTTTPTGNVTVTPMTMSGSKGSTLTGTSTVKGVKTSLGLSFDSKLPTTSKRNTDGSYTLTSKYTCSSVGTFTPTLVAKVDGVDYPINVTITCK